VDCPFDKRLVAARVVRFAEAASLRDAGLAFFTTLALAAWLMSFTVFDTWSVAFMDGLLF
jgi:hypothetical protein